MTDETKRIESAVQALMTIIGGREDGRRYMRHLRQLIPARA